MKEYVGSGKKHDKYDIVKVTLDMEKIKPFIFEYNGKQYVSIDVAPKREVDQYGKTHTISCYKKDGEQSSPVSNDDIPF
jgi:hypothetical protein